MLNKKIELISTAVQGVGSALQLDEAEIAEYQRYDGVSEEERPGMTAVDGNINSCDSIPGARVRISFFESGESEKIIILFDS